MQTLEQQRASHNAYMRVYSKTQKHKDYRRKHWAANRDRMRAEKKAQHGREKQRAAIDPAYATRLQEVRSAAYYNYRERARLRAINHYSNGENCCRNCGYNNAEALCLDHIDDDGAKHRKETGIMGSSMSVWLIKRNFPPGFQVLCHNCNWIKEKRRRHGLRVAQFDSDMALDRTAQQGLCL